MLIRGEALELAFRVVLSCPCDVTHEQESRVFAYLKRLGAKEVADYAPVLDVFGAASTPFHRLAAFTRWLSPAAGEPVIEREHVLRLNASSYHWEQAASTLPSSSRRVSSVSTWMVAHMLLPARLEADGSGEPQATYEYTGGQVHLRHVFLPPEFDPGSGDRWAVHFAAVVGPLSTAETELVTTLLEANDQLVLHRRHVDCVDYGDFELQGDYRDFCRSRHEPFWGASRPSV